MGDACLLSRDKRFFLGGLVAFLLAHVGYSIGFVALGVHGLGVAAGAALFAPFGYGVWRWLSPHTGALSKPVVAYILVICTMACLSIGMAVQAQGPARIGLLVSAIAFVLSDLCVARDRFIDTGPHNRTIGLPLYFGAQLGFALSAGAL